MPSGTCQCLNPYETYNLPIPHRHLLQPKKHTVCFKISTSLVCPLPEYHHLDSALHILSGCQYPAIRNMVTERHTIASGMINKVVSEGSYGSNLLQMDVGSTDRLTQHDLHITEQVSNCPAPPYLFDPTGSIHDQARCNSSCPDAILVTPCPANPNIPPTSPLHRVLCSIRRNEEERSSTTPARQLHELNVQNCLTHLIEINTAKIRGLVPSYKPHSNSTVNCANNFKALRSLSTQSSWVWVGLSFLSIPLMTGESKCKAVSSTRPRPGGGGSEFEPLWRWGSALP
eukprot:1148783-Pelagomonas_calceolata.AAC.7